MRNAACDGFSSFHDDRARCENAKSGYSQSGKTVNDRHSDRGKKSRPTCNTYGGFNHYVLAGLFHIDGLHCSDWKIQLMDLHSTLNPQGVILNPFPAQNDPERCKFGR
jgi:hypothetical protein